MLLNLFQDIYAAQIMVYTQNARTLYKSLHEDMHLQVIEKQNISPVYSIS